MLCGEDVVSQTDLTAAKQAFTMVSTAKKQACSSLHGAGIFTTMPPSEVKVRPGELQQRRLTSYFKALANFVLQQKNLLQL